MIEVHREILEEVAFVRVIAVAEHGLALKVRPIMLQLPLYVNHLRVKFILLGRLGGIQVLVCHSLTDSEKTANDYQSANAKA